MIATATPICAPRPELRENRYRPRVRISTATIAGPHRRGRARIFVRNTNGSTVPLRRGHSFHDGFMDPVTSADSTRRAIVRGRERDEMIVSERRRTSTRSRWRTDGHPPRCRRKPPCWASTRTVWPAAGGVVVLTRRSSSFFCFFDGFVYLLVFFFLCFSFFV